MSEFIVPMDFTITGDAFVKADSPEEARQKAARGQWERYDLSAGETKDWRVMGEPEANE